MNGGLGFIVSKMNYRNFNSLCFNYNKNFSFFTSSYVRHPKALTWITYGVIISVPSSIVVLNVAQELFYQRKFDAIVK